MAATRKRTRKADSNRRHKCRQIKRGLIALKKLKTVTAMRKKATKIKKTTESLYKLLQTKRSIAKKKARKARKRAGKRKSSKRKSKK